MKLLKFKLKLRSSYDEILLIEDKQNKSSLKNLVIFQEIELKEM